MCLNIKRWNTSILVALVFFGKINTSYCQSKYGNIKGFVQNNKNELLIGANVMVPDIKRGTTTDNQGNFFIPKLPAGIYKVEVKYIGYESITQNVKVNINESTHIQFKLRQSISTSEPVVVTGSPIAVDPLNSPQDITSIRGRKKIRLQATSLGKTIESIPGIYSISTGSVAGKPIIRGLTGERISILIDGIAQEYQQYGERHSPNIDPFNAEAIEIIKGAASLLYGSDALGGAINLIPYRLHNAPDGKIALTKSLISAYHSNNNEYMLGVRIGASIKNFGFSGTLVRRNAGNFHTPEIEPFSKTGKRGAPKFTGEIDYTDFEQINGAFSAGVFTKLGVFSMNYNHYYNENNFLLPAGIPIGLRLQNQNMSTKANIPLGRFILKPKFSYQHNHRQATQPGQSRKVLPDSATVDLVLDVYTSRFEIEHTNIFHLSGTLGSEIRYYDHKNIGTIPLQPTGHSTNFALFGFEEWKSNRFTLNFGARFDYRSQMFMASSTNPLLPKDDIRAFSATSGAIGASYRLSKVLTATTNIGRGFRVPSFYNMYVYGYHGGVFAFQIGNTELKNETSLDMSTSIRLRSKSTKAAVSIFQNRINNYIFLYNAINHPLAPQNETFVFAHDQANAVLMGLDFSIKYNLFNLLNLGMNYSCINSTFNNGLYKGNELPLMPADRFDGEIKLLLPTSTVIKSPYILLNMKYVSNKSVAGVYEPFGQFDDGIGPDIPFGVASTDAYTLINIGLGFDVDIMSEPINFDLEITNVFDENYRDFLDTYKGYVLAPGRSYNFKLYLPIDK